MAFRKIVAGLVKAPVEQFVGEPGNLFFDVDDGALRISDGSTPGGFIVSSPGGGGGSYTLPTASASVKGGVRIGANITITAGVISVAAPFSGSYTDLTNKPIIPSIAGLATETFVTSRGYLTSVGTISYNDLTNKPTIPSITGLATETYVTSQGYITSSALSGYALTSQIPSAYSLPTSSASVLGGIKIGTGLSIDANGVVNVTVQGGGTVDLTGYATETYVTTRGYLTSVDYSIITGKPTLFSGSYTDLTNKPTLVTSYTQLTDKPTLFSGSYTDLTNKPTIPSIAGLATETFVTSQGYITSSALTGYALSTAIPTNNNQLTNGAGYITNSALSGLATETYVTTRGYLSSVDYSIITGKPTLFSGSYTDLTNKPTLVTSYTQLTDKPVIPSAYSLPVASTTVLGGIKVDGTSITITDGVISSTSNNQVDPYIASFIFG